MLAHGGGREPMLMVQGEPKRDALAAFELCVCVCFASSVMKAVHILFFLLKRGCFSHAVRASQCVPDDKSVTDGLR